MRTFEVRVYYPNLHTETVSHTLDFILAKFPFLHRPTTTEDALDPYALDQYVTDDQMKMIYDETADIVDFGCWKRYELKNPIRGVRFMFIRNVVTTAKIYGRRIQSV